jgi:pyruvate ferredoxin oxidoreductase alpha subunit
MKLAMTANSAAAYAMKQVNPEVVAAYPITPQTEVVEGYSEYVDNGEVDSEFLHVESEHSAMSACIGASAGGGRVMTATSSQGLALMVEMLYVASGMRLPIVMAVATRALSAPINIHGDHSDTMAARDSGWIQLYCKNCQEVYDNMIQAVAIAENKRLPVMVCYDGFTVSHCLTSLNVLEDEYAQSFIGDYKPQYPLLDVEQPISYGPLDLYDYYFEHKRQQSDALDGAKDTILATGEAYKEVSGRKYKLFENYMMDDAEIALVLLGSTASTAEVVVDKVRDKNIKAGLIHVRSFRPFPHRELALALSNVKAVAVLDKAESLGSEGGALGIEIRSALNYLDKSPLMVNLIYGLGGRDTTTGDLRKVFEHLESVKNEKKIEQTLGYIGLRG